MGGHASHSRASPHPRIPRTGSRASPRPARDANILVSRNGVTPCRRAPDLIGRDFAADRLNQKWYGDGTQIPTEQGKLHLDSVLDMGSRRIVGFAVGEHHDADLATAALQMAVAIRGGKDALGEVIMHTDQGSD